MTVWLLGTETVWTQSNNTKTPLYLPKLYNMMQHVFFPHIIAYPRHAGAPLAHLEFSEVISPAEPSISKLELLFLCNTDANEAVT